MVLKQLVLTSGGSVLSDGDLARVEGAREQATLTLRNFYKVRRGAEHRGGGGGGVLGLCVEGRGFDVCGAESLGGGWNI